MCNQVAVGLLDAEPIAGEFSDAATVVIGALRLARLLLALLMALFGILELVGRTRASRSNARP